MRRQEWTSVALVLLLVPFTVYYSVCTYYCVSGRNEKLKQLYVHFQNEHEGRPSYNEAAAEQLVGLSVEQEQAQQSEQRSDDYFSIGQDFTHVIAVPPPPAPPPLLEPCLFDVWQAVFTCLVVSWLRRLTEENLLTPLGDWALRKQWQGDDRKFRVARFAASWFMVLIYSYTTLYGWYVLRDKEWVPWFVPGSHGNTRKCWEGLALVSADVNDLTTDSFAALEIPRDVRRYYMIQMGINFSHLFFHLFVYKHRRDFFLLSVHHALTILLMCYSYGFGYVRIGTLVLATHDVCDICVNLARCFIDTHQKALTVLSFLLTMLCWIVFRLFAFPFYVLYSACIESVRIVGRHSEEAFSWWFFNVMLWVLMVLHVLWFSLFPRLLISGLMLGITEEDITNVLHDHPGRQSPHPHHH
eukprot:TRINITY_DN3562_c0_g1_i3.p1 TRINITY_DN3562_c0_g1~~TRINITY_DN3562_c0_g1_i3.p1  ORF type:complete len:412 (+),score=105.71 TRINITY_DN3562_c0_g1_i3:24-1259(+)